MENNMNFVYEYEEPMVTLEDIKELFEISKDLREVAKFLGHECGEVETADDILERLDKELRTYNDEIPE